MSALWADPTTMAQLMTATSEDARRSVVDSRLGEGTLTVTIRDGSGTVKLSGTFSGSLLSAAAAAITNAELAGETGDGGTPESNWTVRIANAGGAYVEFPRSAWAYTGDGGSPVIDAADNTFISLSFGEVSYVPGTPPASVTTWITQSPVSVPADFLGIHSDYVSGATYPVEPTFMSSIGTVRSLDHDPARAGDYRAIFESKLNEAADKGVAGHSKPRHRVAIDEIV